MTSVPPTEAIDRYLDQLGRALEVSLYGRRRILAETRDHLLDAAARYRHAGLEPAAATRAAIEDFGPPEVIATAFESAPPALRLASSLYLHAALLAGLLLVTIGLSGFLGGVIGLIWGAGAISGDAPAHLSAAGCERLAATAPGASTCADAWTWHFLEESVLYRGLLGVAGALVLALHLGVAYRYLPWTSSSRRAALAAALLAIVGCGAIALAAGYAATVGASGSPPFGPSQVGRGWWLSIQLASAAVFVVAVAGLIISRRGRLLAA